MPGKHFRRPCRRGFSLVEVALAIGIVAFALVPMLGLMAGGSTTFRAALNEMESAQITQRVSNDLQQTDFATLTASASGNTSAGTTPYIYLWPAASGTTALRYFDSQTDETIPPFTAGKQTPIYQVQVRISPASTLPAVSTSAPAPSPTGNPQLLTATIQVALNPANAILPSDGNAQGDTYLLWTGSTTITTSSVLISSSGGK